MSVMGMNWPLRLFWLVAIVGAVYVALVIVYFGVAIVVTRLDRRSPAAAKIQPVASPPALIARDRGQSIRSLAVIAAMFGVGQWSYWVLGWGWHLAHWSVLTLLLSFVASLILFDAWFYWFHRLLHADPFFHIVHQWHHVTETPTVWSNNSDLAIDNLFLQSYWMIAHFLIPIAPLALLGHKLFDQVTGEIGHSGVEHGGMLCWPPSPLISVTHHDQHHRYYRCNYATHFSVWDRLMGTLHPQHDAELKRNLAATKKAAQLQRAASD